MKRFQLIALGIAWIVILTVAASLIEEIAK